MEERFELENFEREWFDKENPIDFATEQSGRYKHNTPLPLTLSRTVIPLRVMSYNILAQPYATQRAFPYAFPEILDFNYRSPRIMQDLRQINADIVCLQELTVDGYDKFFKNELSLLGYSSDFFAKTRSIVMSDDAQVDGCGIAWRSSHFRQVSRHTISFSQLALQYRHIAPDLMLNRVHPRDNVALVVVLQCLESPDDYIMVACSHLFWDPHYSDVKLVQSVLLMRELECLERQMRLKLDGAKEIPLVLAGDFNSTPDSGRWWIEAWSWWRSNFPFSHSRHGVSDSRQGGSGARGFAK